MFGILLFVCFSHDSSKTFNFYLLPACDLRFKQPVWIYLQIKRPKFFFLLLGCVKIPRTGKIAFKTVKEICTPTHLTVDTDMEAVNNIRPWIGKKGHFREFIISGTSSGTCRYDRPACGWWKSDGNLYHVEQQAYPMCTTWVLYVAHTFH